MRRRAVRAGLAAAVIAAGLTIPGAGPAQAGGGCHRGLTEGRGDTVSMAKLCFSPSILRVDSPGEVTFVNKDPVTHNVSSNGWSSYDDMAEGDRFTATFTKPGVYPFACLYHGGMVGAVVVGDGGGAGSGEQVTVASLTEAQAKPNQPLAGAPTSDVGLGWVGGGILGLALGAAVGLVWRRGRKDPATG